MRPCLLLVLVSLSSWGAEKEKVVLPPVQTEGGVTASTGDVLAEMIASDLSKTGRYELMTAADISAVLSQERQKELLGCEEGSSCMSELGSALGANKLLAVTAGTAGELRVLSMRVVDLSSAKVLRREVAQVKTDAELIGAAHRLVSMMFELPLPPPPSSRPRAGWFVLGGGAVLALGGVGVGIAAYSDGSHYQSAPSDSLKSSAQLKAGVADGLYGGAVIAAGIAAAMLLLGHGDDSP